MGGRDPRSWYAGLPVRRESRPPGGRHAAAHSSNGRAGRRGVRLHPRRRARGGASAGPAEVLPAPRRVAGARAGQRRLRQGQTRRGRRFRDREREPEHEEPRRRHRQHLQERGALQHGGRPGAGARGGQRHHHPPRARRRVVGRHRPRRHDVQRHQDVPVHRGRPRRDDGKIKDVKDRVAPYMPPGVDLFTSPHNAAITWEHLLRQTSDWSARCSGSPTGPTAPRPDKRPTSGRTAKCTSRARSTGTTTSA